MFLGALIVSSSKYVVVVDGCVVSRHVRQTQDLVTVDVVEVEFFLNSPGSVETELSVVDTSPSQYDVAGGHEMRYEQTVIVCKLHDGLDPVAQLTAREQATGLSSVSHELMSQRDVGECFA